MIMREERITDQLRADGNSTYMADYKEKLFFNIGDVNYSQINESLWLSVIISLCQVMKNTILPQI